MASKRSVVVAISGSEEFLRVRALQRAVEIQRKAGWVITTVSGTTPGAVEMAVGAAGCFLEASQTLVIVTEPEKAPLGVLTAHFESGDGTVVVLLDVKGDPKANTKFGKFLDGLGKAHQAYPAPEKDWQRQEQARKFLLQEAKERGLVLSDELAGAIVGRLGTSLGFLWFELLKLATLAEAEGQTEITVEHIKGAMAPLTLTDVTVLADALLTRDPVQVLSVLRRIRQGNSQDPTIEVCAKLGGMTLNWLEVTSLRDAGKSPDDIVQITGKNAWYVKNKLLPPLQRWRTDELVALTQCLARSQRRQKSGALVPWICFTSELLALVTRNGQ